MDEINFQVGTRYRNNKGDYEVLEVSNTLIRVRYVDTHEVQELNKELQSRIFTRITAPPPPPPPVKATRTSSRSTTPKAAAKAKTPAAPKTPSAKAKAAAKAADSETANSDQAATATKAGSVSTPKPTSHDPYQPLSSPSGIFWLKQIDLNGETAPAKITEERQALIFPGNGSAKSRPTVRRGDTLLYFSKSEGVIYTVAQVLTEPRQSDPSEPTGWKIFSYVQIQVTMENGIKQENILLSNNERLYDALDQEGYISLTRVEGLRLLNDLKARANPD